MTMNRSLLIALLVACAIAGLAIAEALGKDSWGKDAWGKSTQVNDTAAKEPTTYPFSKSPAAALVAVNELRFADEPVVFEPGAAEQALSEWVQRGKLTDDQWAEAYLIASGETDARQRQKYVQQLAQLTEKLRVATKGMSPRRAAERLLMELHAGPMSKGYDLHQSSLATLLTTGKQNCVSSTVLYQLQARRLGLNVQAIEFTGDVFEGHVLTTLLDGPREIDIETTGAEGFDCRARIKETKSIAVGIRDLKEGKRIDDVGLLLSLFGNRTVEAAKSGRQFDALRLSFVMLALQPHNKHNQELVEGAFMNWVRKLDEAKQFARALHVGRVGLELMPKSSGLAKNVKASHQQKALELIAAGKDAEVLKLYAAAHQQWPKGDYQKGAANTFLVAAQEQRREKSWDVALAIVDRGLKQLSDNADLLNFVCIATQKHLEELDDKEGPAAAVSWFDKVALQFPTAKDLPEVAEVHVARMYKRHLAKKHYGAARESIAERGRLLTAEKADYFTGLIWDDEARDLCKSKQWDAAEAVYRAALAQLPNHDVLIANAPLVFAKRAEASMDQRDWTAAIKVYNLGLESFPDNSLFRQNIKYCEQKLQAK